ncbi:hypothetical protein MTR67_026966, partial [Solanum verrucosum]
KGIVLGHKILGEGIQVDQAKVEFIAKVPLPITLKESTFNFDEACLKTFLCLKEKLVSTPIIVAPIRVFRSNSCVMLMVLRWELFLVNEKASYSTWFTILVKP